VSYEGVIGSCWQVHPHRAFAQRCRGIEDALARWGCYNELVCGAFYACGQGCRKEGRRLRRSSRELEGGEGKKEEEGAYAGGSVIVAIAVAIIFSRVHGGFSEVTVEEKGTQRKNSTVM
jgi:hypothetical protein